MSPLHREVIEAFHMGRHPGVWIVPPHWQDASCINITRCSLHALSTSVINRLDSRCLERLGLALALGQYVRQLLVCRIARFLRPRAFTTALWFKRSRYNDIHPTYPDLKTEFVC